jgi:hypothetical protein
MRIRVYISQEFSKLLSKQLNFKCFINLFTPLKKPQHDNEHASYPVYLSGYAQRVISVLKTLSIDTKRLFIYLPVQTQKSQLSLAFEYKVKPHPPPSP